MPHTKTRPFLFDCGDIDVITPQEIQKIVQAKLLGRMPPEARAAYDGANRRLSQTVKTADQPKDAGYTQEAAAIVLGADALAEAMKKARARSRGREALA